jgi:hypothetical protein
MFEGFRKAMQTHFLHPCYPKMRLGRSRRSDDSSRRMALRTHNLPSGRLKKDFVKVDEAMFEGD